ncbi:GntR family transcriptional regulator [Nocardia alni]|uniref:GntR family transcriptional regulator n=1 Tax=Nocardia alni TaxID=2815723 RepID=UPI0027DF9DD0|nr:GntR family transcriptional regulator [Nocardia alni]
MSARDHVYETLRRRLIMGEYDHDAALVPAALSIEFAVSRTPVREALGLLERDGLVRGTTRGFVPHTRSEEEILEIFEARAILDSAAAAAAAERRTTADLLALQEISQRTQREQDPSEIRRYLNLWHDAVRRSAHNVTIAGLLHTLDAQAKLAAPWHPEAPATDPTVDDRRAEHDEILAAITARNPERARTLMLTHLARDREFRIRRRVAG